MHQVEIGIEHGLVIPSGQIDAHALHMCHIQHVQFTPVVIGIQFPVFSGNKTGDVGLGKIRIPSHAVVITRFVAQLHVFARRKERQLCTRLFKGLV